MPVYDLSKMTRDELLDLPWKEYDPRDGDVYCCVYWIKDLCELLSFALYIGSTKHLNVRLRGHKHYKSATWPVVYYLPVKEEDLLDWEYFCINMLKPRANIAKRKKWFDAMRNPKRRFRFP